MKKVSGFYIPKHKKTKDLIQQMQLIQIDTSRQKLNQILTQRKNKWKQSQFNHDLKLPLFNYLKQQYSQFSTMAPLQSKQPFIDQKSKCKMIHSDRAYSSLPNLKIGKYQKQMFNTIQNIQALNNSRFINTKNSIVVNKMFLQFDKMIDQQTAALKIKTLKEKNKKNNELRLKQNKNMRKTYFQKIKTDSFNFYQTNQHPIIQSFKSKTDRFMNSVRNSQQENNLLINRKKDLLNKLSINNIQKLKHRELVQKQECLNSTMNSSIKLDKENVDYSIMMSLRLNKSRKQKIQKSSNRSLIFKRSRVGKMRQKIDEKQKLQKSYIKINIRGTKQSYKDINSAYS